jgi:hypothetical protein
MSRENPALGRYRGACKATGGELDAQFAHVWRSATARPHPSGNIPTPSRPPG